MGGTVEKENGTLVSHPSVIWEDLFSLSYAVLQELDVLILLVHLTSERDLKISPFLLSLSLNSSSFLPSNPTTVSSAMLWPFLSPYPSLRGNLLYHLTKWLPPSLKNYCSKKHITWYPLYSYISKHCNSMYHVVQQVSRTWFSCRTVKFIPMEQQLLLTPPPALATTILLPASMSVASLDASCKWIHALFVLWLLYFTLYNTLKVHPCSIWQDFLLFKKLYI